MNKPMSNSKRLIATICLAMLSQAHASSYVLVVPIMRAGPGPIDAPVNPVISANFLSFGPVQAGEIYQPQQLTIKNPGNVPLGLRSVRLRDGTNFQLESECSSLSEGGLCTATVTANTANAGNFSDELTVTHDGPGQSRSIPISSIVVPPSGSWMSPGTFGGVPVGSAKDMQLKLLNSGIGPLSVRGFTVLGDGFEFVDSDCASALPINASCLVTARMSGTVAGSQDGTITADTSAGSIDLALDGTGLQSDLVFTSGPVAGFGRVNVGAYANSTRVTLRNNGNLAATGLQLFTTSSLYTIAESTCGSLLAPESTCDFTVKFSPSELGSSTAELKAVVAGALVATSPLSGVGVNSAVLVAPSTSIASVVVGSTYNVYYRVSNTGQSSVSLYGAKIESPSPLFNVAPTTTTSGIQACTDTLAAGAFCAYHFALTASDLGVTGYLNAQIMTSSGTFTDNKLGVNSSWAKLVSTPSNASAVFGNVNLGESATSAVIKITNKAINLTATNVSYKVPDGFELVSSTCGSPIARNSTCQLNIKFNPTKAQTYAGEVSITAQTDIAGAIPYTLAIPVSGTGVAPASTGWVTPNIPNQEIGHDYSFKVGLYNSGAAAVSVSNLKLQGSSEFQIDGDTCGSSLAAKTMCQVAVNYTPTSVNSASATIQASVGGVMRSVPLSAKGEQVTFKASRTSFAFGTRYRAGTGITNAFADISVTYTNTSGVDANNLNMAVIHSDGQKHTFSFQNNSCVNSLAAGATCSVSVRANTTVLGPITGSVQIASLSGVLDVPFTFTTVLPDVEITGTSPVINANVGDAYTATYTVTNRTGLGLITVEVPTITGNTAEYSLTSGTTCNGSLLSSGGSCVIKVLFTPTGAGPRPSAELKTKVGGITRTVALQASGL